MTTALRKLRLALIPAAALAAALGAAPASAGSAHPAHGMHNAAAVSVHPDTARSPDARHPAITRESLGGCTACSLDTSNGVDPSFSLHASQNGGLITVCDPCTFQTWAAADCQSEPFPGGSHTACLIILNGNGNCVNIATNTNNDAYLNSCHSGDANEMFWWDPDGVTGGYWLINEAASNNAGAYLFLTAALNQSGSGVDVERAGAGGRAAWLYCSNCS